MTERHEALRRVAEAATKGEWHHVHHSGDWGACVYDENGMTVATTEQGRLGVQFIRDAEHIAKFDPPTVKVLLDIAEAAERLHKTLADKPADGWLRLKEEYAELGDRFAKLELSTTPPTESR